MESSNQRRPVKLYLEEDLLKLLQQEAKENCRSVSGQLRQILREHLRDKGLL